MNAKVNFSNLVRQLLPSYKRQPVRLWWLQGLVSPLRGLFADFDQWRTNTRMILNVNSQVKVLEGYLRWKYRQPVSIKIITYADGALMVGLEQEGETQRLDIALGGVETRPEINIPLVGEMRVRFDEADFLVYIPPQVDIEGVRAEIERFKQALVRYQIIQK